MNWRKELKFDPVPSLSNSKNEALRYLTRRDLMNEYPGPVAALWRLPVVVRARELQRENGAWRYHGGRQHIRSLEDYDQIETFRVLRELVEKYGLTKTHPAIIGAAEFMFSHQTAEGDFRGICGRQYIPYYSGAIMELLIKAGYGADPRIQLGFNWLISMRQEDGGWAFPLRTIGLNLSAEMFSRPDAVQPDRRKPSSHLVTGMVLRAFAAHPSYRKSRESKRAAELLAYRLFKPDTYPDRRAASFWTSFSYPFWFTDLLSSLDSLSTIGFDTSDPQIRTAAEWFIPRQRRNGLWELRLRIMAREKEPNHWISLAICRVFKKLYQ